MSKFSVRDLTLAAMLAAVYAVLTMALPIPQYGGVQIRFAEALTVLPFLFPAATPGLFVGCIIANLFSPFVLDVVFGSMATLLACLVTYKLRDIRVKGLAIPASLPPVVFNMLIVGAFEITFFFSDTAPTLALACFNAVAVAIGELISCTVLGVALVKLIESNESLKKIFTEE